MLDTFNYEQTFLETTTSLLNHDLHWALAHLRASVTRGLVPRQDTCNICLLQYRRRHDPPEEIVIFRSGVTHAHCGIPPLKPRPGRARGTVKEGVYPPAGDTWTWTFPPISGMGDTWRLGGGRPGATIKEATNRSTAEAETRIECRG
ncbi:unnamed protein product [Boreogadus saida]